MENDFHDVCQWSLNTGEEKIIATLDAYQNASLKGDQNKLYVGAVTLIGGHNSQFSTPKS